MSHRPAARLIQRLLTLAAACAASVAVHAETVNIAVAASFTEPAKALAAVFQKTTGHTAQLSFGATGAFYSQIKNGAPFDVLMAADDERPQRLEKEGDTVPGSRFTYATGQLVLWSAKPGYVDDKGAVLKANQFNKLAVANPKNAPYGAAAMQAMGRLGVAETLKPLFVQGENISQTQQFVSTGAADLGFVAYSQVIRNGAIGNGSGWLVPENLYDPIRQDAVILARGKDKPAAAALLAFLKSEKAKDVIRSFGYGLR